MVTVRAALLAAPLLGLAACHAIWPTLVRPEPDEPIFRSGFPLVGSLRTDGALCSLASVGPEATLLVAPPEAPAGALGLRQACDPGAVARPGQVVEVLTGEGMVRGHLWRDPGATGLLVAFSGMGMPAAGWINTRFAERGARRGLATFAVIRDESPRPIVLDPLREARGALEAAAQVREACGLAGAAPLFLVGISLGGLEALLAGREALRAGQDARAAVLDPVLDVGMAAAHLDSWWHPFADDGMQAYFRRILRGRWGEPEETRFQDVMRRLEGRPGARTRAAADAPSAWLCGAPPDRFAVFLSDTDPVLGDEQRAFGQACGYPFRPAGAPGHTPFACRLPLFDEMLDAVRPAPVLAR
jgi:hypothetical protein